MANKDKTSPVKYSYRLKGTYLFLNFILLYWWSLNLQGQSNNQPLVYGDHVFSLSEWTRQDGLPSWLLIDMIQDKTGYIWLICDNQFTRFDGKNFKVFQPGTHGLKQTVYTSLAEDRFGKIWLLSHTEAHTEIEVFDPLTELAQPLSSYLQQDITLPAKENCNYRFFGHNGTIWTVFANGESWVFDTTWRKVLQDTTRYLEGETRFYIPTTAQQFWRHVNGAPDFHLIDSSGHILKQVGFEDYRRSFYGLDDERQLWQFNHHHQPGKGFELLRLSDSLKIFTSHVDTNSWMPASKYKNLDIQINSKGYGIFPSPDPQITGIFFKDEILISDLKQFLSTQFDLQLHSPVFQLDNDAFWFATTTGLVRLEIHPNNFKNYLVENTPISHSCRGIYAFSDSDFYVNTINGTYHIKDHLPPTRLDIPVKPSDNYGFGMSYRKQKLWISFIRKSLYTFDPETGGVETYHLFPSLNVNNSHMGSYTFPGTEEELWLSSDWGLLKINEREKILELQISLGIPIHYQHQWKEQFWLGTDEGMFLLKQDGSYQQYPIFPTGAIPPPIYHIYEDEDAFLWLATNQGLIKWKPFSDTYLQFKVEDGLSNNKLHAIYPDKEGNLWLSSNYGLMRFNKESYEVRSYFVEDGLPNNELNRVSHFQDEAGKLYFGGLSGLSVFDPKLLNQQLGAPLQTTGLQEVIVFEQANQAVDVTTKALASGRLDLPPSTNRLRIKFATPYFGRHQVQYVWRIGDTEWNELEVPMLEVGRLPYGAQQLELGAFLIGNKSGTLVTNRLTLTVLKPFYLQLWFFIASILALILAVGALLFFSGRRLQARNKELELRVAERTQGLAEQNKIITKQAVELQQLDEAKSRFFVNLSHELRTPLSLILGPVTELIEKVHADVSVHKQLLRIERNTQKIKVLVEEITMLARLDAKQIEPAYTPVHWYPFIKRIFHTYHSKADENDLSYQFQYQGDEASLLLLDAPKVERIISNLLGNALKFTPANGTVVLSCQLGDDLLVSVKNSGTFIPEKERRLIFERYYQVPLGRHDHRTGFGIGLALSKEYTLLLEGTLEVHSNEVNGTRFDFRLPKKLATSGISATAVPPIPVPISVDPVPHSGMHPTSDLPAKAHLLLVEDDLDMLDYIRDLLVPVYQITIATDGQKALAMLQAPATKIDLIISDAMMPNMDGFELITTIRKNSEYQLTPFVLLTALSESNFKMQALRTGVDAYLTKPFLKQELLTRVDNLLQNQAKRKQFLSESSNNNTTIMKKNDLPSYNEQWMQEFSKIINDELHQTGLKISDIADRMHISERTLRARTKENTGLSPAHFLQKSRLDQAMIYLENRHYKTIAEVCYAIGLRNSSHFSRAFKKEFGKPPSEYL